MYTLKQGTPVNDIRGRHLGTISAVLTCCVQFSDGRAIQREAVVSVSEFGIELICDADQLARYACPIHTLSSAPKAAN